MLNEKLLEVIHRPPDSALTLVTQGPEGPHLINSWKSYLQFSPEGQLLFPAGGMEETQANLAINPGIQLAISNRQVQGFSYQGCGFIVRGTALMATEGPDFDQVKAKFPWARAALVVKVLSAKQTL